MFLWQRVSSCTKLTDRLWFRKKISPCRSSGDASGKAVPKRGSGGMKAPRRRNCGADGLTADMLQILKKN